MNYAQQAFKLVWFKELYSNLIFLCPNLQEILPRSSSRGVLKEQKFIYVCVVFTILLAYTHKTILEFLYVWNNRASLYAIYSFSTNFVSFVFVQNQIWFIPFKLGINGIKRPLI